MTLPELPPATLRLKIDADALAANWRAMDALSGDADAGAAVKANAYGLGAARAVPVLRDAGCRQFYVAHWSEVPDVLAHIPADQLSVLHGPVTAQEAVYAKTVGVRPVLNSIQQVARWLDAGGGPCDVMVDTGINRLGLPHADIGNPLLGQLDIDTIISHLASADEDSPSNAVQLGKARDAFRAIASRRKSLANSAGIALGKEFAFDLTRPGLALYGGIPRDELSTLVSQVAYPQAAVMQIRNLHPGEGVGYNSTYVAQQSLRVAVAAIGYADGYLRCWSNKGVLHCNNNALPILGRVSMDMVVVDASTAPDLREGDWLDVPWQLPEAARSSGLSQYELLTLLGSRFDN